jgi:hypothetical protein
MNHAPLRVAVLGIGWWSDVLADAVKRSKDIEIVACYSQSEDKRRAFAAKYDCSAAASYDDILGSPSIAAILNTTPNNVHLQTTALAAKAGKHVFLEKPIANTAAEGQEMPSCAERRASCWRWVISVAARVIFVGSRPRSTRAALAEWCRPSATSAATGLAKSTRPRGVIRRLECPAA